METNKYKIIFEKLEQYLKENEVDEDIIGKASHNQIEYDEIKELCRLSVESNEDKVCLFTTT
jgi:hypothetical protein